MVGWNERDARFDHRPELEPPMQWDEALLVRIEQLIGALKVDSPEDPAPSRSLRILYADDNPINQRVAGEMLRKAGHRVDIAASGAEAVTAMDDGPFDVVLMDVQMPDFDGCNATAAIRARERHTGAHTPILGVTAYSTPADEARCLEAGMDAYVAKPISEQSLLSSLQQLAHADTAVEGDESAEDEIATRRTRHPEPRYRRAASHRVHASPRQHSKCARRRRSAACRATGAPIERGRRPVSRRARLRRRGPAGADRLDR